MLPIFRTLTRLQPPSLPIQTSLIAYPIVSKLGIARDKAVTIAVVLGALVLAGLYAVLNDTVMPTVTQRIQEMFNYAG